MAVVRPASSCPPSALVRQLDKLGITRGDLLPLVQRRSARWPRGPGRSPVPSQPGLESSARRDPRADRRPRAGAAGAQPARVGGALHRRAALLRLGGNCLPLAQSSEPDHQPGLHRGQSRRRVPRQDHRAQPALADGLHVPEGRGMGLVLSLDGARRLLALYRGVEAVHDDAGQRLSPRRSTWRWRPPGSTTCRWRTGHGCSPTTDRAISPAIYRTGLAAGA